MELGSRRCHSQALQWDCNSPYPYLCSRAALQCDKFMQICLHCYHLVEVTIISLLEHCNSSWKISCLQFSPSKVYPPHIYQDNLLQCTNIYVMFLPKCPPMVFQYYNMFSFLNPDNGLEDHHLYAHLNHATHYPMYSVPTTFGFLSFPKKYAPLGSNSWSLTLPVSLSRTPFSQIFTKWVQTHHFFFFLYYL